MSRWPPRISAKEVALSKLQAPGRRRDEAAAGVGEVRVLHALRRAGAEADDAVLALEGNADARRHVARHQRRQADAEVHQRAVAQFERHPPGDELLGVHPQRLLSTRWSTRMPEVRTASGGMTPSGTISSASAITRSGRHRHERVEVRRRQPVGQVEEVVGLVRMDQRDIGAQRRLEQVVPPVDRDHLLTLGDDCADPGRRQDAAEARARRRGCARPGCPAARAPPPSRAVQHPALRHGVRPDVRGDHTGDAAGIDQPADTEARPRRVVGDHRQVARVRATSASSSRSGVPTPRKPPIITLAPSGTSLCCVLAFIADRMLTAAMNRRSRSLPQDCAGPPLMPRLACGAGWHTQVFGSLKSQAEGYRNPRLSPRKVGIAEWRFF